MSEKECIEFIKQYNIQIPNDYSEETWAPFVKEVIGIVELNPDYEFAFNYAATLMFANEIKDAVNDYYGIVTNHNAVQFSREYTTLANTYVLQDSSAVGSWMQLYSNYNCYVYSIETPAFIWVNPGYWSGQTFSISQGIMDIVDLAMDDLAALGHERIYSNSTMETTNLCTNEKIICVRRGTYDYHFMKLDDGVWYHKPGSSAILRYKYAPSVMRTWSNEALMSYGPTAPTTYYDSVIIYISYDGHNWGYTYNGNGVHTKTCSICGDAFTGNCTYTTSSNGNGTHTTACTDCGNGYTNSCSFDTVYLENGQHFAGCTECGAGSYVNCTNMYIHYVDGGEDHHKYACAVCGHESGSGAETCTFDYVYYGVVDDRNAHVYACTTCGHVDSGPTMCFCIGVNPCALCGHVNDHISLGIEEEELVL